MVGRYGLRKGLVRQEGVQDIDYGYVDGISDTQEVFTVQSNQARHYARTVVLAIGPANAPVIPGCAPSDCLEGACHTMHIKDFPDPSVSAKIKQKRETNVMIIGGGLTSAQIADLAVKRGVTKVWLLMRGHLKGTTPFRSIPYDLR